MPNGRYVLNDLEFDREIRGMSDRDLMEFTAKLAYGNAVRISKLETVRRRSLSIASGVGTLIGAAFVSIIEYVRRG